MKQKNTYFPEDIEQLLMKKKYEELLPDEEEFVLQHVDSKEEYNLMRNTLLAIKKEASNHQSIKPKLETKENLMLLLEKKKNRGGWFNLNGFWNLLFPEDTSFFQKPGFQFASIVLLAGIGLFIARTYILTPQADLALMNDIKPIDNLEEEPSKKSKESFLVDEGDNAEIAGNINQITNETIATETEIQSGKKNRNSTLEERFEGKFFLNQKDEISNGYFKQYQSGLIHDRKENDGKADFVTITDGLEKERVFDGNTQANSKYSNTYSVLLDSVITSSIDKNGLSYDQDKTKVYNYLPTPGATSPITDDNRALGQPGDSRFNRDDRLKDVQQEVTITATAANIKLEQKKTENLREGEFARKQPKGVSSRSLKQDENLISLLHITL